MFCLHLAGVDQFKQILTTFGQNSVEEVVKYCENVEFVLPNYLIFDFAGITWNLRWLPEVFFLPFFKKNEPNAVIAGSQCIHFQKIQEMIFSKLDRNCMGKNVDWLPERRPPAPSSSSPQVNKPEIGNCPQPAFQLAKWPRRWCTQCCPGPHRQLRRIQWREKK